MKAALALASERGLDKSICPSKAARRMDADWRSRMTAVHEAAIRLARRGRIVILRKGAAKPVAAVKATRS